MKDHELEIGFTDGTISRVDFSGRICRRGGVFEPLENIDFFAQVSVDPAAGTIVWPNGVDFCPDVLYAEATGRNIAELGNELEVP